jgi:cortexillin 1/2
MSQKERSWELVQIKAFTSWLNGYLEKRSLSINNLQTDLTDGVKLIKFLELLSNKKVTVKYDENPSSRIQKIQNLHIALKFLEKEMDMKVAQLGIGAEDFADQNLKMILGFLWSLFKKYRIATIKHQDKSSEEGLILWCKQTTEGYKDVNIEGYKTSFRDGMAFLALVDKFVDSKDILDFDKFQKDKPTENLSTAFEVAEKAMGIPRLLEAQDVADGNVDERSLVLYISLYFHAFVAKQQQKLLEDQKSKIEEKMRGLEGSLEERAKLAAVLVEDNEKLKQDLEMLKQELETERSNNSDLKDKNSFLEERVEVFKQLLEQENLEKEENQKIRSALESDLESTKADLLKTKEELDSDRQTLSILSVQNMNLEIQVSQLQNEAIQIKEESERRKKECEINNSRSQVELNGLGVLKRNLEEHLEDLKRWQKYLDLDKESTVDFAGEIRPQIMSDIAKEDFDKQLQYLTKKLEKENVDMVQLLKQKEAEAKAKKAQEDKKRERQKKNDN